MSIMGDIVAQDMQWFAVRVRRQTGGGIRKITVGGEFETYRDRSGHKRKRRVDGTGNRVFLPEHLLRRAGFEVFLPVKKVQRRKNRFSPEKIMVTTPLLVDWLFVGWPAGQSRWHQLMALDVVCGVLGTGGRPVAISPDRVVRLMRQWGGGVLSPECHRMMKSGGTYSPGDVLALPDGPFQDFDLTVHEVTDKSVRGIVSIFGRDTPIEVPLSKLPVRTAPPELLETDRADAGIIDETGGGHLSACACGHRAAQVVPFGGAFCVKCGNCGGRAAVGSQSAEEARRRWNRWRAAQAECRTD